MQRLELARLEQGAQPLPALAPLLTLPAQRRRLRLRCPRRRLRNENTLAPHSLRPERMQLCDLQLELVPCRVCGPQLLTRFAVPLYELLVGVALAAGGWRERIQPRG